MDQIVSPPETRARSRSKTPMTRAEENGGRDSGRRSPNLQPIVELSMDPIVQSPPAKTTSSTKRQKAMASASQEAQKSSGSGSLTTSNTTTTIITQSQTSTKRKSAGASQVSPPPPPPSTGGAASNNGEATVTTPKDLKEATNRRTKEMKQNEINERIVKRTITSTPKISPSANFKLVSCHEGIDLDQHPPYKEYLEAGEYWNKYPKTDYTYSEHSPHRRELAPGYINMPNMSRKSLDSYTERMNNLISQNPEQESFIRRRFQLNPRFMSKSNKSFSLFSRNLLNYDSGDENDMSGGFEHRHMHVRREFVLKRVWVSVWTWITTVFQRRQTTVTREQFEMNYGRPKGQSMLRRATTWTRDMIMSICTRLYLILATILYLDTWLLRRRTETVVVEKGAGDSMTMDADAMVVEEMPKSKKRFLWLLAILLPLLLIAGGISNKYLETTKIREFLLSTEQEVTARVVQHWSSLRSEFDTRWMDAAEYSRRNMDVARDYAEKWLAQVKQLWDENFNRAAV